MLIYIAIFLFAICFCILYQICQFYVDHWVQFMI